MIPVSIAARTDGRAQEAVAIPIGAGMKRLPDRLRDLDRAAGGVLSRAVSLGDLGGKPGSVAVLYPPASSPVRRILAVGVGKDSPVPARTVRDAVAAAAARADSLGARSLALVGWDEALGPAVEGRGGAEALGRAVGDGLGTGVYRFDRYRTRDGEEERRGRLARALVESRGGGAALKSAIAEGGAVADARSWARDVSNEPANRLTPTRFADEARKLARGGRGLRCTVLGPAEIRRLGMGAFWGVAQGSDEPPRLIVLEYRGGPGRPLGLVGKGITFDSGGISLKDPPDMHKMKMDMAGAAGVLAATRAAADLRLRLPVVAVVPATENMPGGRAQRPGDVVRTLSGKTVEVQNTDAEGRLVLADGLAYTERKFRPRSLVDMATLTGAMQIALGRHAIGVLGTDDRLVARLRDAGESVGERVWPLPLWDDYKNHVRSDVADLRNIGHPREAGTIIGGIFLRQFVKATPWAHLDIASTAWTEEARGATGVGVRLLVEWLRREARS
ncbi:MAG: leucyl aminopeptidase [Planctomycetales bacterium]|nr:leucyl aminopeptidase [Planctomycetales bacterium]